MRRANYLTNICIVILLSFTTCCLSKTEQVSKSKNAIKNSISDTLKLHHSASTHVINGQLEPPLNFLDRTSKEELMRLFSKEKVEKVSNLPDSLVNFGAHPFLMGMWKAYQEHRPFVISPDVIWTLIE